jgi:O-acetyl-ADP-ribose deacetylase (regulator of RNase III)
VKKLLLAAVSVTVFTLNGVNQVQLVAVIAFSAGVFAGRFRSASVITVTELTSGN